ncbi:hypothetical protein ABIC55_000468 [Sporosarcina psychrophila]|uniref:Right handed beta helix domain-containing protein n=1 Tax=Sporosarcina psychrophila TaxID=1476 RepID=A0ABV2K5N6_SPOPS
MIEIYGNNVKLDNVEVTSGAKNGIYVNNNGQGAWTVTFNNIKTSGNAWAGIGLVAQTAGDSITANFTGTNTFAEATNVYADITGYQDAVTVTGLSSAVVNAKLQKVWTAQ